MQEKDKSREFEQDITDKRMVSIPQNNKINDDEQQTKYQSICPTTIFEQDIQVRLP
ncbi:MAG: hypothetical protein QF769_00955 [Candidatus Marinimicrobia bacterium]|jgi:hypothetical protein|nr:hypothetical protein [Candidatus Neomarinimicrobiota bacterium]|tara:strand:- start:530 stop:697 length:168 start_codon:yes stop_codon:yes gene_type:complete